MPEIEMARNNLHLDPVTHIWGWEVPVYLFLGGLTAGVMILSALIDMRRPADGEQERSRYARWMPFTAPLLLSAGMLALFIDLENRLRAYRFYLSFEITSPMSWGSWILIAVYPATVALGLACLSPAETRQLERWPWMRAAARWSQERRGFIGGANIALGVGLGAYTGLLLGTLAARAAWNSGLLAPLFLVSGVSTGAALMMLLPLHHQEHELLRRWDMAAIGLELALVALFFLDLAAGGGEAGKQAAGLFFGGPYTAVFWSLVVIAGLVVPLLLESLESRGNRLPTALAPALLLAGGLALRFVLVAAGQA